MSTRAKSIVVAAIAWLCASSHALASFDYNTAKRAVVTIYCESPKSFGGGVAVSRSAIITLLHVVDKCKQVIVGYYDGTTSVGHVTATDDARDLALVMADSSPEIMTFAQLETDIPQLNDAMHTIGHPNGLTWTSTTAQLTYPDARPVSIEGQSMNVLVVNTPGFFGSSGGALFNDAGRVVGFAKGALAGTSISFYIPSGAVCRRLIKCKAA